MRFGDFLRTTVLLSAGSATALALVTMLALSRDFDPVVTYISAGWWLIATYLGLQLGSGADVSPPIARVMADARHQTMLPELRPSTTLLNRLWPLLIMTLGAKCGDEVTVTSDDEDAMTAISNLVKADLDA